MNLTLKIVTFLALLTIAVFFVSNEFFGGYLSSSGNTIGNEIGAPSQALYEWHLVEKAPYKYRLLFPAIVKGSWYLIAGNYDNNAFFLTYKFWSLFFLVSSVVSFFFLIKAAGFNNMWSLGGGILFLSCPAILFAYTLPVHTREDTLAYTLLCLGLLCILRNHIFLFFLISLLGVFCRETLLILPFVFLFFRGYKRFIYRALIAVIPVSVWVALRLLLHESVGSGYDPWEGLKWNMHNMEQVLGFSFITFHFMWLLFFYGITRKAELSHQDPHTAIGLFYQSGFAVFGLIVVTTFLGGIFNEIRLLFMVFPWLIIISLHLIYVHQARLIALFNQKKYQRYCLANMFFFGVACIYLVNHYQQFVEPSKYGVHFDVWIAATITYFLMIMLMIPVYRKIFSDHNTFTNEYAKHH